jgi:hypothetical protein
MGGPVFGASGGINLAYYDNLEAMRIISKSKEKQEHYVERASKLKKSMLQHLYNDKRGISRLSYSTPEEGICHDVNGYAMSLGITPRHDNDLLNLVGSESAELPLAFRNLGHWDMAKVVSPYASGFAVEALFRLGQGDAALSLLNRVWGVMANRTNANYSGGHWEALTPHGKPHGHDTSLMHAWSTWPVFLLPEYLAGLKPLEPGWSLFKVEPMCTSISYVGYDIEIRYGRINIEVLGGSEAEDSHIIITMPAGTRATIIPPPGFTAH